MPASASFLACLSASGIACSSALRTVSNRFLASSGSVSSASCTVRRIRSTSLLQLLPLLLQLLLDLLALVGVAERSAGRCPSRRRASRRAGPGPRRAAWPGSRISVMSSENWFDDCLRSWSRRSFSCWPARVPSVSACESAALLQRLGGLADVLAALLDLLAGLGHAFAVLLVLHPLLELVGVAEDLLLLVAEPLELPLDLLRACSSFAASRADCSSFRRSFRSAWRWASSLRRLSTCRVSRCSCSFGESCFRRAGAAPRSGSPGSRARAGRAAAARGCRPTPRPPRCRELLRTTSNSRALSLSSAW